MLLTITYTGRDTPDLGYLLYKNPNRGTQTFDLAFGRAHVFYPEITDTRTTAALLLDIDPLDLAKGKGNSEGLFDYVNDRPYVSSSFMSVAISKVFGTAMTGRADSRQELSDSPLDLSAEIAMLPCNADFAMLARIFEPLGYTVSYENCVLDERFPEWGESRYVNLSLRGNVRLRDLLKHIYVLLPVFDRQKHYWVGDDEVDKLLRMGEDWLEAHPERKYIVDRYLYRQRDLVGEYFSRLNDGVSEPEVTPVREPSLNAKRLDAVFSALKDAGAHSVIDLGCGEGRLLSLLLKDGQFTKIAGMDVAQSALKRASDRLRLETASERISERVTLFQGSLTYRDGRIAGYDAASVMEVIEHMDATRLAVFERVVFDFAKPRVVVLTTPNRDYNAVYEKLSAEDMRHGDHRFEWTRAEFAAWVKAVCAKFGYRAAVSGIGEEREDYGSPTQMGVFERCE
ncbi:MAG: 3' terminal RNA ribose 2'-O-methyltransferase Hen1 [Oscillospiraceae bacterium]|jgi:3' terminal RNA ribose 2'-O-methyltransferase Hen1|nr:3' terminal RNA ribose 2'-O-methyltransferase Hen1 [Oscillospiraceae bacterium]